MNTKTFISQFSKIRLYIILHHITTIHKEGIKTSEKIENKGINTKIFKAYDIRGVYPEQLNEELIYEIGRSYVKLLLTENPEKNTTDNKLNVCVGEDMRLSSPSLSENIIKGITDAGANVVHIGLASTPQFYFSVGFLNLDAGMIVSASHNPQEYNGVKIVRKNGYPVGLDDGIDIVRDQIVNDELPEPVPEENKGKVTKNDTTLKEMIKYNLTFDNFKNIKPLKIVVDTANAMGIPDLKELFKNLPCEVIWLNDELDGTFPAHEADPMKPENTDELRATVIKNKADLGIATDGDNDRIFFIDNNGEFIEPAITRGIFAKEILKLHPKSTICYDIRPGMITRDMIVENGGTPVVSKVGHSLIKKQAIEIGAEFAGESSGHFFFKTYYGFYEQTALATLIILKEISESGKSMSEIVEPLKRYVHSGEINFKVEEKEAMMKTIEAEFKEGSKEISWLDGVTVEHEEFWFNVRPSNTEPLLRVNLEGRSKEVVETNIAKIRKLIEG